MNSVDVALGWLEKGIPVIPIRHQSKRPSVRWARWQSELPSETRVRHWFASGHHNLGLIMGNGLSVLDFDDMSIYTHWRSIRPHLSHTYTVITSRGRHTYFWTDNPTTMNILGVDVKTSGYVLAPPSIHPSGHQYVAVDQDAEILRLSSLALAFLGMERTLPAVTDSPPPHTQPRRVAPTDYNTSLPKDACSTIKSRVPILAFAERYTIMHPSDTAGLWYLGRCPHPDHPDIHPSFRVDAKRNYATCLTPSCRLHEPKGLSVIDLYMRLAGVTLHQAIVDLSDECE